MKKIHIVFMVLSGYIQLSFAQDCELKITGRIIDFHDGEPLENATISFDDTTVSTDIAGFYTLNGLCPKNYAITIEHANCNSQVTVVNPASQAVYNFNLEHHSTDLTTVSLHATGDHDNPKSIVEAKLDKGVINRYRSQSLGDALTELTGVSSLNTGSTIVKPVIQGLHSSRVLMINNGVRQQDQEWGVEHAPNMDLNAFESIRVVKGAGALQYGGDAIGGVVITESKFTSMQDTIFGRATLSGNSNGRGGLIGVSTTMGFKNGWSAKIQGGAKRFGDVQSPDYVLSNTGVEENTLSLGVRKHTFLNGIEGYYSFYEATQGILRASHIGNVTDLIAALRSTKPAKISDFTYAIAPPKQEMQHHLAKLKAYHRFKNFGKLSAQYAYQANNRKEFDIRRGSNRGRASVDLELITHRIETSVLLDSNDDFTKNLGIQFEAQKNTPNPDTGVRRLIPDFEKITIGAYAIGDLHLNDQWSLDFGLRYDNIRMDVQKFYRVSFWENRAYDPEFSDLIQNTQSSQHLTFIDLEFQNLAFSGGLHYVFDTDQDISFNAALVNRAPNPVELFSDGLHHSASIIELGDLRIQQEQALKFSMSYRHQSLFKKLQTTITPHYSAIKDFILLKPTGLQQTIRGAFPVWEYQQTDAILFGIDMDIQYAITSEFFMKTGFSYVYGQDTARNEPLILMPPPTFTSEIGYATNSWNVAVKHIGTIKQSRFPDNNFPTPVPGGLPDTENPIDISTPPSGYHIYELFGNYTFLLGKRPLDLGFRIQNIFNSTYRNYLNRQRYYADELGRNFLLNINYKF